MEGASARIKRQTDFSDLQPEFVDGIRDLYSDAISTQVFVRKNHRNRNQFTARILEQIPPFVEKFGAQCGDLYCPKPDFIKDCRCRLQ